MFQIIYAILISVLALGVISCRCRWFVFATFYRLLQVAIVATLLIGVWFCLFESSIEDHVSQRLIQLESNFLSEFLVSTPVSESDSKTNINWLYASTIVGLAGLFATVIINFFAELSSLTRTHCRLRNEIKSSFREINRQLHTMHVGNLSNDDLNDIDAATNQLASLIR